MLMTSFETAPVMLRGLLGTWCFLTCLAGAGNIVMSMKQKKRRFLLGAIPLMLVSTFLLQVVRRTAKAAGATLYENPVGNPYGMGNALMLWKERLDVFAGTWPVATWGALLAVMTGIAIPLTLRNFYWREKHVTPLSIQESFERLTEGLCYYRDGGQCVLVNSKMHELCRKLMGHVLMNGEELEHLVFAKAGNPSNVSSVVEIADQQYLFSLRKVPFEGETIRELIASNITELYQKTMELEAETKRLQGFQEELQKYHGEIQENVRREEILRAKMNIHDEMNRLLLATRNAIASKDMVKRQETLYSWRSNALLLCKETEGTTDAADVLRDLQVIAKSLGVEIVMIGSLNTRNAEALRQFVIVTREAMNNAVKHAGAKHVYVEIRQEGAFLRAIYTNDGRKPENEQIRNDLEQEKPESEKQISDESKEFFRSPEGQEGKACMETGGLKNMRQKLEEAGGSMEVTTDKGFRLEVLIRV